MTTNVNIALYRIVSRGLPSCSRRYWTFEPTISLQFEVKLVCYCLTAVFNNQQKHFFFGGLALQRREIPLYPNHLPAFFLLRTSFAITINAQLTFIPLLELTSSKIMLCFRANSLASRLLTCRSASRSIFVPKSTLHTSSSLVDSTCLIHLAIFLKLSAEVISQASIMALAPLKQVWVILRKRSCPAVSQICSLILVASTYTVLSLKSTPMVATQFSWKRSSQNLVIRLVFPTPLSPTRIILAKKSCSQLLLAMGLVFYIRQFQIIDNFFRRCHFDLVLTFHAIFLWSNRPRLMPSHPFLSKQNTQLPSAPFSYENTLSNLRVCGVSSLDRGQGQVQQLFKFFSCGQSAVIDKDTQYRSILSQMIL